MKQRKFFQIIAGLLLISNSSLGQLAGMDVSAASETLPGASSQGTANSNYDVDLYTGIASISIPIYNYSVDDLNLGVSLNYNTKGIKVDQTASSVGLGWNLNACSYIERDVRGVEDEIFIPASFATTDASESYSGTWVNATGLKDNQTDVFTLNLAGRAIQFQIVNFGTSTGFVTTTSPANGITAQWVYNGAVSSNFPTTVGSSQSDYITFKVTDEKGNVFYFNQVDIQNKNFNGFSYYAPTKWYCTQIVTYTGKTINYTYSSFPITFPYYQNQTVNEYAGVPTAQIASYIPGFPVNDNSIVEETVNWTGYMSHIKAITYPNNLNINFNNIQQQPYNRIDVPGQFTVNSISINNKYDNFCSNTITYLFDYAYFNTPIGTLTSPTAMSIMSMYPILNNAELNYADPTISNLVNNMMSNGYTYSQANNTLSLDTRLKLKGIRRQGTDGTATDQYYTFTYNTTSLPPRLSNGTDYFGYYNNGSTTPLMVGSVPHYFNIPYHNVLDLFYNATWNFTPTNISYGTDRTPNINYLPASVLTSMTNGMGGTTTFSYKAHSISAAYPVNSDNFHPYTGNNPYDGLCIDKIVQSDGYSASNTITKSYNFTNGVWFGLGAYFWYPTVFDAQPCTVNILGPNSHTACCPVSNPVIDELVYTNNFLTPLASYRNSNHGYTNASVTSSGFNNEKLSETDYTYWNIGPQYVYNLGPQAALPTGNGVPLLSGDNSEVYAHNIPNCLATSQLGLVRNIKFYQANNTIPSSEKQYSYANCGHMYNQGGGGLTIFTYRLRSTQTPTIGYYDPNDVYNTSSITGFNPGQRYYYSKNYLNNSYGFFDGEAYYVSQVNDIMYSGANSLTKTINYTYDTHLNILNETWTDSKGDNYKKEYDYTYNYFTNGLPTNSYGVIQHLLTTKFWKLQTSNGDVVLNYNSKNIVPSGNFVTFPSVFASKTTTPIQPSALADYPAVVSGIPGGVNFFKLQENQVYDDHGNVLQTRYNDMEKYSSAIYDTRIGEKIATATNAKYTDIAYTSFEGPFTQTGDYNNGNWHFDNTSVKNITSGPHQPLTGQYYLELDGSSPYAHLYTSFPLTTNKSYRLSFWAFGGVAPNVTSSGGSVTLTRQYSEYLGWTLYTADIIGNGSNGVAITGNAGTIYYLDELRLSPSDATFTTYTYQPMLGISSKCDDRNNITFYEYDKQGRQYLVRDIDGNIKTLVKTALQDADN